MKKKLLFFAIMVVSLSSFTLVGMQQKEQAPVSDKENVPVASVDTPAGGMAMEDENQWN
jgi:hypothetical protein